MARNTIKKSFSLKDHLFNTQTVSYLGELFAKADKNFKKEIFVDQVMTKLLKLSLKERIVWIAEVLEHHLPKDFAKASKVIIKALPEPLDPTKTDDDFGSFILAPLGVYVVRNGLDRKHAEISLETLLEITQRFSMEDSIRYFINTLQEQTLEKLSVWVTHDNYHVRRLVSEGTRPMLPWSSRITLERRTALGFLDELHADKTRYVTRSVANHLNDISKKEPMLVIQTLQKWHKLKKQNKQELDWMTKHALRTLVKKGNKEALMLLGFNEKPNITVGELKIQNESKSFAGGDVLAFSCEIGAKEDVDLLIDYVIHFVKAKGETKPKVFKIKKVFLKKGEVLTVRKNHRLIADATTFSLHAGIHMLEIQINGEIYASAEFVIR